MKKYLLTLLIGLLSISVQGQEGEDFLNSQPIDISGTVESRPAPQPKAPKKHPMVVRMEKKVEALKKRREAREKAIVLKTKMKMEMIRIKKAKIEEKKIAKTMNQAFSKLDQIDSSLGDDEDGFDDFDDYDY